MDVGPARCPSRLGAGRDLAGAIFTSERQPLRAGQGVELPRAVGVPRGSGFVGGKAGHQRQIDVHQLRLREQRLGVRQGAIPGRPIAGVTEERQLRKAHQCEPGTAALRFEPKASGE